jgi:hypothetical protein
MMAMCRKRTCATNAEKINTRLITDTSALQGDFQVGVGCNVPWLDGAPRRCRRAVGRASFFSLTSDELVRVPAPQNAARTREDTQDLPSVGGDRSCLLSTVIASDRARVFN